jgi:hypothetical protein
MIPARARLSLILEESMIIWRKKKFIRNVGFIGVKISFQSLTNVCWRFVLFNEKLNQSLKDQQFDIRYTLHSLKDTWVNVLISGD